MLSTRGNNTEDSTPGYRSLFRPDLGFAKADMVRASPRNPRDIGLHLPIGGCGGGGRPISFFSPSSSVSSWNGGGQTMNSPSAIRLISVSRPGRLPSLTTAKVKHGCPILLCSSSCKQTRYSSHSVIHLGYSSSVYLAISSSDAGVYRYFKPRILSAVVFPSFSAGLPEPKSV